MNVERNADEDDIVTIKDYVIKRMGEITSDAFFTHGHASICWIAWLYYY